MGDERKIKDNNSIIEKTKEYFFDGLSIIENKIIHSNIEDEYKNSVSRRNKGLAIILILFAFAAISITWFVSETLSAKSVDASVNIDNFRELNLAEIVQNIKSSKSKIKNLETALAEKQYELQSEIEKIRNKAKRDIANLDRRNMNEAEYQKAVRAIETKRDDDIKKLVDLFGEEEISIKKEIESLGTQIKVQEEAYTKVSYEALSPQRGAQALITNEQATNNIIYYNETLEQDYYILIRQTEEYRREVESLDRMLKNERARYNESQSIATNISNYMSLVNKLENENTLLKNQVEENKKRLELVSDQYTSDTMANSTNINAITSSYNKLLEDLKREKLLYYNNLETLLNRDKSGAGYVVDYSNDNVRLFISKLYNIENGERVFLYRGNTFIAELEITSISEDKLLVLAKVIRTAQKEKISVFDSVILGGLGS